MLHTPHTTHIIMTHKGTHIHEHSHIPIHTLFHVHNKDIQYIEKLTRYSHALAKDLQVPVYENEADEVVNKAVHTVYCLAHF